VRFRHSIDAQSPSKNPDGPPVFLLHGGPYDPRSFDDVVGPLASVGFRVIVPYLRCFSSTIYRDSAIFRSGEQAAVGKDVIDLIDAPRILKAIPAGFDWGNRAACAAAALAVANTCAPLSARLATPPTLRRIPAQIEEIDGEGVYTKFRITDARPDQVHLYCQSA
jgi:pimeloyl-ACP methyl ester carboxylesterase